MNYQFTQLGVNLSTLMPTVSEAAVNLIGGPTAAEVLQHPSFQNCYYVPPSLRTRAPFDRTPPSTGTGRCVEQRSARKYSAPGALPNAKTTSPKSHVAGTVQRKLEMDGKDFNKNEKSMQNSVRQPKYRPQARSSSWRTTVTHGIVEATEKLSSMNLGGGRQAMMQPIPLPMKAGGWHGRSGMFFERSQFSRDPTEPEPFRGRLQDDLFSFVGFYNKQVPPCLMQLHSRYMVVFCGFL